MKSGLLRFLLVWLALVVCAPVPFFLVQVGIQPVAAVVQLLSVTLVLIATEGSSGAVTLAAGMLAVQILVGLAVLALFTRVLLRMLDRVAGERALAATVVVVTLLFAIALTQPIYRTPFRTAGLRATLVEVFE